MIGRRTLLALIGLAPAAAASAQGDARGGGVNLAPPISGDLLASTTDTDAYVAARETRRLDFWRLVETDEDFRHRAFMQAKAGVSDWASDPLPSDIANKRSWSPAFKQLQMRHRQIALLLEKERLQRHPIHALDTMIGRFVDGGR